MSFIIYIFQRLWLQRLEHLFLRKCFSGYFEIFVWGYVKSNTKILECNFVSIFTNYSNNILGANCATLSKKTPTQVFSCKYCKIFKNTYFKKLLWTAASENTCIFIKHSNLISFFYKMKKKWNSIEITQAMKKEKIAIRSSKYEQPLYNCFKNINFAFSLYSLLSKTHHEIEFL